MFPRPIKRMGERLDTVASDIEAVSAQVVKAVNLGILAFVLVSIVAVTALIVTVGKLND